MKNYFVTIEGIEGVGKSTAIDFIADYLTRKKCDFVLTREPGGTKIGESIRDILLQHRDESVLPETELLLLFAARAQHIAHVIKPALSAGKWVVSDRFTDASFAYQGGGREIPMERIDTLAEWVQGDLQADLTLLLDAPVSVGLSRMNARGEKDRIEREKTAFFERARAAYVARAQQFPDRFAVIQADCSLEEVQMQIQTALVALER